MRNKKIFEDQNPNLDLCCSRSLSMFTTYAKIKRPKSIKFFSRHLYPRNSSLGFFYGSSMEGKCGSGMVVKMNDNHFFNLWMGSRIRSTTRVEMMRMWGVLFFADRIGIDSINTIDDLKILIEWEKGNFSLQVSQLNQWGGRVNSLIESLHRISFTHIYRCFNEEAYMLSKLNVNCREGILYVKQFMEDSLIFEGSVDIF